MGSCAGKSDSEIILPAMKKLTFPRRAQVKILVRDTVNQVIGLDKVKFDLKIPIQVKSSISQLNNKSIVESQSILPGMDPRNQYQKECQDGCFVDFLKASSGQQFLIAGLFDGHGKEGAIIVSCCKQFMKDYFHQNQDKIEGNQADLIKSAYQQCEQFLKQKSDIDSNNSGCTCIIVLIGKEIITTASIGDSRCILGYLNDKKSNSAIEVLDINKPIRKVIPTRSLEALQLTVDQKPEQQEEFTRLVQLGAQVRKVRDDLGNEVGPYRVYKGNTTIPGLAMSRSLGDFIGIELGIVTKPIITYHKITPADQFIALGSDGIWQAFMLEMQ